MNKAIKAIGLIWMLGLLLNGAQAAQRTVLFEHFSEELCSYCPEVAAVMADFRSHYTPQQTAIISFYVRGTDAVPHGIDRLEFYNKEFCPEVVGDGQGDFEELMPIEESQLVSYYNTRTGVSAPCTMEVIKESNTQYRIRIYAEQAIAGSLMAVAYEDVIHDGTHYPCFARQMITPYYGEDISLAAGESTEIVKTVEVQGSWNPANMGMVAYIHESAKNGRAFRAHAVMQAADSKAPHTNPTATPTPPECTPTPAMTNTPASTSPPGSTPTPSPTSSGAELQQDLELNQTMFHPGNQFTLKVHTVNPTSETFFVDQYLALQVGDAFFFSPCWEMTPCSDSRSFNSGCDNRETILDFAWPSGAGSFSPLYFWLASIRQGTAQLAGPFSSVEWGYSE